MKKHIIGLALFSFIVSAAAVVYAFVTFPKIVRVSPQYAPTETTYCKFKKSKNIFEIKQAVYSVQTKRFDAELLVLRDEPVIALHFFSKCNNGTHYLETVEIENSDSENGFLQLNTTGFDWLNKRKSYENFFMIAEPLSQQKYFNQNNQPKFDAAKATAITIDYGK